MHAYNQLLMLLFIFLVSSGCVNSSHLNTAISSSNISENQVVYSFAGIKDPTLIAEFVITYVATNKDARCVNLQEDASSPLIKEEKIFIKNERYTKRISINTIPQKDDLCGFKFATLDLIIRRAATPEVYNRFPILGTYPSIIPDQSGNWAHPIYNGSKYGSGMLLPSWSQQYLIPYSYRSNMKYFKIASETQFKCKTFGHENAKNPYFLCLMDISDAKYQFKPCRTQNRQPGEECGTLYHPEFELETLQDSNITLNIIADKK